MWTWESLWQLCVVILGCHVCRPRCVLGTIVWHRFQHWRDSFLAARQVISLHFEERNYWKWTCRNLTCYQDRDLLIRGFGGVFMDLMRIIIIKMIFYNLICVVSGFGFWIFIYRLLFFLIQQLFPVTSDVQAWHDSDTMLMKVLPSWTMIHCAAHKTLRSIPLLLSLHARVFNAMWSNTILLFSLTSGDKTVIYFGLICDSTQCLWNLEFFTDCVTQLMKEHTKHTAQE